LLQSLQDCSHSGGMTKSVGSDEAGYLFHVELFF
jgi:hypothetical protein